MFDIPMTAHFLGGATIGDSPATGVIDPYHRVYGHPGLHVVDGSAISANIGVNPSLTITAQAERALSMWPNRGSIDPRPQLGSAYAPVPAIPPRTPAVPATPPGLSASLARRRAAQNNHQAPEVVPSGPNDMHPEFTCERHQPAIRERTGMRSTAISRSTRTLPLLGALVALLAAGLLAPPCHGRMSCGCAIPGWRRPPIRARSRSTRR